MMGGGNMVFYSFPEEKLSPWKVMFWVALAVVVFWLAGCAQFRDTVGCYSGSEMGLGYAHNFGDSSFSGNFRPDAHGSDRNHGGSSFSGNSFSEDRIDTDVRVHFAPGSCK